MKLVSEICPLCKEPVQGAFSLIIPDIKSFFLMRYNKVHPKCLVKSTQFGIAPPGMASAYGGTIGDLERRFVKTVGRAGATALTGNLNYLWAQMSENEREKMLTRKIVLSFDTPQILFGRVTLGYSAMFLKAMEALVVVVALILSVILVYFILNNIGGFLTTIFLILLPICLIAAVVAFMIFRSLAECIEFFEKSANP